MKRKYIYLLPVVILLCLACLLGCASYEDIVQENGYTYRVSVQRVWFVTIREKKEQITITDKEFNDMMLRKEREHAMEMLQKEQEHEATLKASIDRQKLKEKQICTVILGVCLFAAAICTVVGYITHEWKWCGGLSLLLCGIAAAAAMFGEVLNWIYTVSGFAVWVFVAGLTLWLFRKFSLLEWIKRKLGKDEVQ